MIDSEKAEQVIEKRHTQGRKIFDSNSVSKLSKGRKLSGILNIYENLKNKINKSKGNIENDSREK